MDIFGFFFIPGDILPSVLQMEKKSLWMIEWMNKWVRRKEGKEEGRVWEGGKKGKWRVERKEGNNIQIFRNESDDI